MNISPTIPPTVQPNSARVCRYSDLLDPVPNALPLFKAEAAQSDQTHTNQVAETVIIKKKAHHHHHHHHHDHD